MIFHFLCRVDDDELIQQETCDVWSIRCVKVGKKNASKETDSFEL